MIIMVTLGLIGLALVVGIVLSQSGSGQSNDARGRKGVSFLSVTTAFCVIAILTLVTRNVWFTQTVQSGAGTSSNDSRASSLNNSSDSSQLNSDPDREFSNSDDSGGPRTVATPMVPIFFLGILILGTGIVLSLRQRNVDAPAPSADAAANSLEVVQEPTPLTRSGWNWFWLVTPVASLAILVTQSVPVFSPVSRSEPDSAQADLLQRNVRTLRQIKENVGAKSKAEAGTPSFPVWLRAAADQTLKPSHRVISSGFFSTHQEAEKELIPIVAALVQQEFQQEHAWQGEWEVPVALVRERAIESTFLERMPLTTDNHSVELFRMYMLLNLSDDVVSSFETDWKATIVQRRLAVLGIVLSWLVAHLLLAIFYFRIQGPQPKLGRWRWKLAGTIFSVALTAGAVVGLNSVIVRNLPMW